MSEVAQLRKELRVVLVDDHPMLRRGVSELLETDPSVRVVAEHGSGREALEWLADNHADLILLDMNMREMDGVETLRQLRRTRPTLCCVIFSVSDDEHDVVSALQAGANGYLLKDMEPEDLLLRIHEAVEGDTVISPKLAHVLARAFRPKAAEISLESLTPRERQTLKGLAAGLSNKQIARKLDIADGTVKVHVKRLLKKLGLRTRVEAAVWAVEHRLK